MGVFDAAHALTMRANSSVDPGRSLAVIQPALFVQVRGHLCGVGNGGFGPDDIAQLVLEDVVEWHGCSLSGDLLRSGVTRRSGAAQAVVDRQTHPELGDRGHGDAVI